MVYTMRWLLGSGRRGWRWVCGGGVILVACGVLAGGGGDDYAAFKREALASLQGRYEAVAGANGSDRGVVEFKRRLESVDAVVGLIRNRLRWSGAASLDAMVAEVAEGGRVSGVTKNSMTAAEILSEYEGEFSGGLARPEVGAEGLKVMLEYYGAAVRAAESYVAGRCRVMGMMDEKLLADAIELSMVVPLLVVSDESWSMAQINSLPEWLRSEKSLEEIEGFALTVRRPLAAYQFAAFRKGAVDKAGRVLSRIEYLREAAAKLWQRSEYHGAMHCVKVAIEIAEAAGKSEDAVSLHLRHAEMLSGMGHAKLAAEEALGLLRKHATSASYGRAAMLRLKYLYESEELGAIVEEAPRYGADWRAGSYLPQIVFIQWQSLRRLERVEEMKKAQELFLGRFPEHPLGAEMHFASAMSALASFDYAEASRLLEIIEYRYPDAKMMPKVKEIQGRLRKIAEEAGEK